MGRSGMKVIGIRYVVGWTTESPGAIYETGQCRHKVSLDRGINQSILIDCWRCHVQDSVRLRALLEVNEWSEADISG